MSLEGKVKELYSKATDYLTGHPAATGIAAAAATYPVFDSALNQFTSTFMPRYDVTPLGSALLAYGVGYCVFTHALTEGKLKLLKLKKEKRQKPKSIEQKTAEAPAKKPFFWKLYDFPLSHPAITALAYTSSKSDQFIGTTNTPQQELEHAVFIYAGAYVLTKLTSKILSSQNLRVLWHSLHAGLTKNQEKSAESYQRALKIQPNSGMVSLSLAEKYFTMNRLDDGVSTLLRSLTGMHEPTLGTYEPMLAPFSKKLAEKFQQKTSLSMFARGATKHNPSLASTAGAATALYAAGYIDKSAKFWQQAVDIRENSADVNCLYGLFLTGVKEKQAARKQWEKTVEIILSQPDAESQFRRIPSSRFEVYELPFSDILSKNIIINKSHERPLLERKSKLTEFLSATAPEGLVASHLAFVSYENSSYLVTRRARGQTLEAVLEQTTDPEIRYNLIRAAALAYTEADSAATRNLAEAERFGVYLADYDYPAEFKRRFLDRTESPENQKQNLKTAYALLSEKLVKQRIFSHGDAHHGNIIFGAEKPCVIDPERAAISSPYFDLAYALEQSSSRLPESNKIKIVSDAEDLLDLEKNPAAYFFNAMHVSFCLSGTSISWFNQSYDAIYAQRAQAYLTNAAAALASLKFASPKEAAAELAVFESAVKPLLSA